MCPCVTGAGAALSKSLVPADHSGMNDIPLLEVTMGIWVYMSVGFVVSLVLRRNDIADVFWGPGFLLIGALTAFRAGEPNLRGWLVLSLILLWALRLSLHIATRNRSRQEDFRYQAWREQWGRTFYWRSYLQVWLLQGFFMGIVSSPLIVSVADRGSGELGAVEWLGLAVFCGGFLFEAIADLQLARFKRDPANHGHLIQSGLWSRSRHPNYFGEAMLWWGIWILSLKAPGGFAAIIGPLVITYLLRFVSGVPMLERKYEGHPEFERYKSRTPAFVPRLY